MTQLSNGTVATDLDAHDDNAALSRAATPSATSRPGTNSDNQTCIVWDAPEITEADLPF